MKNTIPLETVYFPNGELNATYILANANILLNEGEIELAMSLFRLFKDHKRYSHCAHYGLGMCFARQGKYLLAVSALEKALEINPRTYVAQALVETLLAANENREAEKRAVEFAQTYSQDETQIQIFRQLYEKSLG